MIDVSNLSKSFGNTKAIDGLSFQVQPGQITGFLGPNGSGKSTTMRIIMGLDWPDAGQALINGRPFAKLTNPLYEVGALLDARAFHGGRSAYNHLLYLAQSNHIPPKRVDEVLELVGLSSVARKKAGTFSMGMGQRLGIASALLGDPGILLFDEPVNGLDPEGILWVRNFLKSLASQGRTVLVSSHLMSEMALTADSVVVIGRGRLIDSAPIDQFIGRSTQSFVIVKTPDSSSLQDILRQNGASVKARDDGSLEVTNMNCPQVGELAASNSLVLHELYLHEPSLESAYMELTQEDVEFQSVISTQAVHASN